MRGPPSGEAGPELNPHFRPKQRSSSPTLKATAGRTSRLPGGREAENAVHQQVPATPLIKPLLDVTFTPHPLTKENQDKAKYKPERKGGRPKIPPPPPRRALRGGLDLTWRAGTREV